MMIQGPFNLFFRAIEYWRTLLGMEIQHDELKERIEGFRREVGLFVDLFLGTPFPPILSFVVQPFLPPLAFLSFSLFLCLGCPMVNDSPFKISTYV